MRKPAHSKTKIVKVEIYFNYQYFSVSALQHFGMFQHFIISAFQHFSV